MSFNFNKVKYRTLSAEAFIQLFRDLKFENRITSKMPVDMYPKQLKVSEDIPKDFQSVGEFNAYRQAGGYLTNTIKSSYLNHVSITGHVWVGKIALWGNKDTKFTSLAQGNPYVAILQGGNNLTINEMVKSEEAYNCFFCFLTGCQLSYLVEYLKTLGWVFGPSILMDKEKFKKFEQDVDGDIVWLGRENMVSEF